MSFRFESNNPKFFVVVANTPERHWRNNVEKSFVLLAIESVGSEDLGKHYLIEWCFLLATTSTSKKVMRYLFLNLIVELLQAFVSNTVI